MKPRKKTLTFTSKLAAGRLRVILGLVGCLCSLIGQRLSSQPVLAPDQKFWTPDGPVNAILPVGDTVFIGGDFTYVGPRTGPAVRFDEGTGQLAGRLPQVIGTVRTAVPDGRGGWFIGGAFSQVGRVAIAHLAHLQADGTVDSAWDAKLTGTTINALAFEGGRLYVGGQFTKVAGQPIPALVGLDAESALAVWNPHLSGSSVNALKLKNNLLYAGGLFSSAGGSNRQNLAAIGVEDAVATSWNPGADNAVLALEILGNTLYVGGQFNNAGTKPRSRLAAIDLTTGVAAAAWNPNPNGIVRALAAGDGAVYVGGDFTTISVASRRGFAALDAANGAAQSLDLQLQTPATINMVRSLLLSGDSLYVGGQFTAAVGEPHVMLVGVDLTTGATLPTPRASELNGAAGAAYGINALSVAHGLIFAGGDFLSAGGVPRQRAAALSLSTGEALSWAPAFSGSVFALAAGSNRIYVGGAFTNVNTNVPARGLAWVDATSGAALPFPFMATNGNASVTIRALNLQNNTLYVGGAFTVVTNLARRMLVALNTTNGAPLPVFDAKLGGGSAGVSSLLAAGGKLYVSGDFTSVNGVAMNRLTSVALVNGAPVPWTPAPNPNQAVNALTADANHLYVGGQFATINGVTLRGLAVYNLIDNSLVPLDASLPNSSVVGALGSTGDTLYVGGNFTSIGGENRRNLAALATANTLAYGWAPAPDAAPSEIALNENYLFCGGPFRFVPPGQANAFFAAFRRSPQTTVTVTGPNAHIASNNGDRVESVLQSTTSLSNPVWQTIATNTVGFPSTNVVSLTEDRLFFRVLAR